MNLHVDFNQPKEMVFNRARLRRAFVALGQVHLRDTRRLLMRRKRSSPGENPGYQTGKLSRSIGYYVPRASSKRPGLMVKLAPNQKLGKGSRPILETFYPAFLHYGVRSASYHLSQKQRRQKMHHHRGGWRIVPRNNYMIEALNRNKDWTRYFLLRELKRSLRAERRNRSN